MFASHPRIFVGTVLVLAAIVAITIFSSARADTYSYDVYGRLIGVTYTNGSTVTYTYDAAGNRTAVSQTP